MNKSDMARTLARRLDLNIGRANALLVAASDFGVLPKARGREAVHLSSLEQTYVILSQSADLPLRFIIEGNPMRQFIDHAAMIEAAEHAVRESDAACRAV